MEERAEKEQQQSQKYILEKICQLYSDSLKEVQQNLNIVYQIPILRPKQIIQWKLLINLLTLFAFFEISFSISLARVFGKYGCIYLKELETEYQVAAFYFSISFLLIIYIGLDFITAYYKYGVVITESRRIAINFFMGISFLIIQQDILQSQLLYSPLNLDSSNVLYDYIAQFSKFWQFWKYYFGSTLSLNILFWILFFIRNSLNYHGLLRYSKDLLKFFVSYEYYRLFLVSFGSYVWTHYLCKPYQLFLKRWKNTIQMTLNNLSMR